MTNKADKHNAGAARKPAEATHRPGEPFVPRQLTQAGIEALRQDNHRRHEENMKALETMDLSRLKG